MPSSEIIKIEQEIIQNQKIIINKISEIINFNNKITLINDSFKAEFKKITEWLLIT